MRHCIASYVNKCKKRHYLAISLKTENFRSTLGLYRKGDKFLVDQHYGKFNLKVGCSLHIKAAAMIEANPWSYFGLKLAKCFAGDLMTKNDLVKLLAVQTNLSATDVQAVVDIVFGSITESLVSGGKTEIRGFGSFFLSHRESRVARNPRTGEPVQVPAKDLPRFRAGKPLLKRLNGSLETSI